MFHFFGRPVKTTVGIRLHGWVLHVLLGFGFVYTYEHVRIEGYVTCTKA
jgi:hypothetical protein